MSEEQAYSSRNADKFVIRLPRGMRVRIFEAAQAQHRSMNMEIVSRLKESLDAGHTPQAIVEAEQFQLSGEPAAMEAWTPAIGMLVEHPGGWGQITDFYLTRGQVFVSLEVFMATGKKRADYPLGAVRPARHRISKDFT